MDPAFFDILVCPLCKGGLTRSREPRALVCKTHRIAFPIDDDGAAVMLPERAFRWPSDGKSAKPSAPSLAKKNPR